MSGPARIGYCKVLMQGVEITAFLVCGPYSVPEGESFRFCIREEAVRNVPAPAVNKGVAGQAAVAQPVPYAFQFQPQELRNSSLCSYRPLFSY